MASVFVVSTKFPFNVFEIKIHGAATRTQGLRAPDQQPDIKRIGSAHRPRRDAVYLGRSGITNQLPGNDAIVSLDG
jgi:hypothetical protein